MKCKYLDLSFYILLVSYYPFWKKHHLKDCRKYEGRDSFSASFGDQRPGGSTGSVLVDLLRFHPVPAESMVVRTGGKACQWVADRVAPFPTFSVWEKCLNSIWGSCPKWYLHLRPLSPPHMTTLRNTHPKMNLWNTVRSTLQWACLVFLHYAFWHFTLSKCARLYSSLSFCCWEFYGIFNA